MTEERAGQDVVVIGAGIVGLSVAHYLLAEGRNVLIIDRKGAAEGASQQNAGALAFSDIFPLASPGTMLKAARWMFDPLGPLAVRPSYAVQILPWLVRFANASRPVTFAKDTKVISGLMRLARQEFHAMMGEIGASSMIRRDGSLTVYESEAEFQATLPQWQARADEGIAFEHVSGERLQELQPDLSNKIVSATYVPEWETVSDPCDVALTIFRHCLEKGANFMIDEAISLAPSEDQTLVHLKSGKVFPAKHVVVAAGAWSRKLALGLGDHIPLDTERGYNTTLPLQPFQLKRQIIFGGHGFVATPLETGIRIGGAVEFGGLRLRPNFKRSTAMLAKACQLLPKLKPEGGRQWMGFRPSLPDSLPVISHAKASRRVIYAFGHGHLGLTQSAATGRLVRDLLLERESAIDISPFRATRFSTFAQTVLPSAWMK
jgi:D-amino-acid dehydrogenase